MCFENWPTLRPGRVPESERVESTASSVQTYPNVASSKPGIPLKVHFVDACLLTQPPEVCGHFREIFVVHEENSRSQPRATHFRMAVARDTRHSSYQNPRTGGHGLWERCQRAVALVLCSGTREEQVAKDRSLCASDLPDMETLVKGRKPEHGAYRWNAAKGTPRICSRAASWDALLQIPKTLRDSRWSRNFGAGYSCRARHHGLVPFSDETCSK
jgi:hypothetical protein